VYVQAWTKKKGNEQQEEGKPSQQQIATKHIRYSNWDPRFTASFLWCYKIDVAPAGWASMAWNHIFLARGSELNVER
jgi:hypothetical protein